MIEKYEGVFIISGILFVTLDLNKKLPFWKSKYLLCVLIPTQINEKCTLPFLCQNTKIYIKILLSFLS